MKVLSTSKRVSIVSVLVDGCGINTSCRLTDTSKHTVLKLLQDLGCVRVGYHHRHVKTSFQEGVQTARKPIARTMGSAKTKNRSLDYQLSQTNSVALYSSSEDIHAG